MNDIQLTIARVAERIRGIEPEPEQALQVVYENPKAALVLNDFPCAIVALSPNATHSWNLHGSDVGRHVYTLSLWILVGAFNLQALPDLHGRILPYPQALAVALLGDITLGGTVDQIGQDGPQFFTYKIGPIQWGGAQYFGMSAEIQVQEKPAITIG